MYNVAGNVWEWCQDWVDSDQGWKVLRGGSWHSSTSRLRVANRDLSYPTWNFINGFRCVLGF
ncbi:TPA: hypothetical protein EYN98_14580 [Candidatus Poribacteria bacterium]|nr:hypothetical protein [Candidatus Poribacteria bacterium]HIA67253.1 hypothetical protein [Candidatus Poribacteria bacterium]HIB86663.1 hypothetical protein [Candidatus Poribacteria bacterium]